MAWDIEYSDTFGAWWGDLSEEEQDSIAPIVGLLESEGPTLGWPYSSDVKGSRHGAMRELRVQHQGRPYRVLYAFDPTRAAYLILGGDKTGNARWYEENVPKADREFDERLKFLEREG